MNGGCRQAVQRSQGVLAMSVLVGWISLTVSAATVTVDFSKETGPIRPLNGVNNPAKGIDLNSRGVLFLETDTTWKY